MKRLFATVATLALFVAPAHAADYVFPPAPVPGERDMRPVTTARDADPAIWVVKDADTTIYLFGTIHLLPAGRDWFNGPVKAAYDAADQLVIEMVEPPQTEMQQLTLELGVAKDGVALRDRLSPEARAKYEAALTSLGVPVAGFDSFKPWLAAVTLGVLPIIKAGYDPTQGVERSILAGNTKPVEGLETARQQLGFFADLPMDDQIAYLNTTVDGLDDYVGQVDDLVAAWAAGDVDRVADLMNEGLKDSPADVARVLLADRNARWAKWIESRLKQPGTVFLAVGAGHLAGPESVQAKLAAEGVTARRIVD